MSDLAPNQRIHDVLDAIHRGRYRVPSIQRGYEWDEGRVIKLLDSIMSGYPFGAVMVWRPPSVVGSEIPSRRFVQHFESTTDYLSEPTSTADENSHLVLDGQQRLQSLYLSFFGTYNKRAVYLQIDHIPSDQVDDTDYKFEFLTEPEAKERPAAVRLSRILQLDSETKYEFARETAASIAKHPHDPAEQPASAVDVIERVIARNVDRFIERFNMQQVLLFQEISGKLDYDHVLEIFERVNSGGMVLDKSDLLFSTLKLKLQKMEQGFMDTLAFLNHGERYDFNTDFLIKTCLVVFDQRAKYEVSKLKNDSFVKAVDSRYKEVDYCLRHLSTWLDDAARIKCSRFLRSKLALIPLVDWMLQSGNKDRPYGDTSQGMIEYLYMASFRRLFRPPDNVLDQLHVLMKDQVQRDKTTFPINAIRAYASERQRVPWKLHGHYFDDDVDLSLNIVDGGVLQIDPADTSDAQRHRKDLRLEVDHIFPRSPLTHEMGLGDVVDHIGNYRLVVMPVNRRKKAAMPTRDTAFFAAKLDEVSTPYEKCIATVAKKSAVLDRADFLAFRDARAEAIKSGVSAFLGVPHEP